jgi:hypothetical protein
VAGPRLHPQACRGAGLTAQLASRTGEELFHPKAEGTTVVTTFMVISLLVLGSIIAGLLLHLHRMQAELEAALRDPSYGISTRQGLDRRGRPERLGLRRRFH